MPKVNPELLIWARKTAGFSTEDACRKLGIASSKSKTATEKLNDLESGRVIPSSAQLELMAKKYRRPLIALYLNEPPSRADRGTDYRQVNKRNLKDDANIDVLIREIYSRQNILRSSLLDEDEEELDLQLSFVNSLTLADGVTVIKESIVSKLDLSIEEFYRHHSIDNAFSYLRTKTEKIGVFVLLMGDLGNYHSKIDVEIFRGFSIADNIAPFIVINSNDAKGAWAFTLLHELTHIWLGQTGISSQNTENIIEKLCDEVASEILLPSQMLANLSLKTISSIINIAEKITQYASDHNVSSTMVAYRLYQDNQLSFGQWQELNNIYMDKWTSQKTDPRTQKKKSGPDYYTVVKHKLGNGLLNSVHRLVLDGSLTSIKAARILGVNVKNVGKLIDLHASSKVSINMRSKQP